MITSHRTHRARPAARAPRSALAALAGVTLLAAMALAGCGSRVPTTDVAAGDLDVFLSSVRVTGTDDITAQPLPAGTLHDGRPLVSYVRVRSERELVAPGTAFFAGTADRVGGGPALGARAVCGRGWTPQGRRVTTDPCQAAEPHVILAAGEPQEIPLWLYPRTGSGPVTTGTYRLTLPFEVRDTDRRIAAELTYRVVAAGTADRPPWPKKTVPWRLTFEPYASNPWRQLKVRIEDGYGRVLAERDMADYDVATADLERDGVFSVRAPVDVPWHIVLFRRVGDRWTRCSSGLLGAAVLHAADDMDWPGAILTESCGAATQHR